MLDTLLSFVLIGLKLWRMLSDKAKAQVADAFMEWLDSTLREFYRQWA